MAKYIIAIEPNPRLREIARHRLGHFPSYCSISGTLTSTARFASAIDLVVSARSVNWIENDQLLNQYQHILRQDARFAWINNYHLNENLYSSISYFFSKNIASSFLSYSPMNQQLIRRLYKEGQYSRESLPWQTSITHTQFVDRIRLASNKTQSLADKRDLEKKATAVFELLETNGKFTFQLNTEIFVGKV